MIKKELEDEKKVGEHKTFLMDVELGRQKQSLSAHLKSEQATVSDLKKKEEELLQKIRELDKRSLAEKIIALVKEIRDARIEQQDMHAKITALEQETTALKEQLEAAKTAHNNTISKSTALEQETTSLKHDLSVAIASLPSKNSRGSLPSKQLPKTEIKQLLETKIKQLLDTETKQLLETEIKKHSEEIQKRSSENKAHQKALENSLHDKDKEIKRLKNQCVGQSFTIRLMAQGWRGKEKRLKTQRARIEKRLQGLLNDLEKYKQLESGEDLDE